MRWITLDCKQFKLDYQSRSHMGFFEEWDEDFRRLTQLLETDRVLNLVYEDDIIDDPLVTWYHCAYRP